MVHVGVDIGGTKVLAVELAAPAADTTQTPDPRIATSFQLPMPGRDAADAQVEQTVVDAALAVADGRPITGLGVAAAGMVDGAGGRVRFAAHLPWRDAPVRQRVQERLAAVGAGRAAPAVLLENDANCAAYAELVAGAAREVSSALLVTVGTGIGGALVLDGRVVRGANGAAGEFGHMPAVPDGLPCECGLRGCWEQYASGRALERAMAEQCGPGVAPPDGPGITARARDGDPAARRAIASVGARLGVGVAGLVSAFDPALVVIGGGVSAVGDLLLDPAREAMVAGLQGTAHRTVPPLVPARFGPEGGAIGAALWLTDEA